MLDIEELFLSIEDEEGVVRFDGLDDAIIGVARIHGDPQCRLAYSEDKIIACLMEKGMGEEDAWGWYDHNIACLYAGPGTPVIVSC